MMIYIPLVSWGKGGWRRRWLFLVTLSLLVVSRALLAESDAKTDRDAAVAYFASAVRRDCSPEQIEILDVSPASCRARFRQSLIECTEIAKMGLPALLGNRDRITAMIRFSLCRGFVMQGLEFDLDSWTPSISQLVEETMSGG